MGVVVAKQFDVVYDDFSGGHFVGSTPTHQPRNTFTGYNVACNNYDATLMPLESSFTIISDLAGDTPANCQRPIGVSVPTSSFGTPRLIFAGNTKAYSFNIDSTVPPATVASVALTQAVSTLTTTDPVYFPPTDEVVFIATDNTKIMRVDRNTTTCTQTTVPTNIHSLMHWGQFLMAISITGSAYTRVYYSNPGTAATWTSTDFFTIADSYTSWCVHQGNLYISTNNGWWAVTGIPNVNLSVRQITTADAGYNAASIDSTVLTLSPWAPQFSGENLLPSGPQVRELAGGVTRPFMWHHQPDGRPPVVMADMVKTGRFVVACTGNQGSVTDEGGATLDLGTTIWVFDIRTGRWHRRQEPSTVTVSKLTRSGGQVDLLIFRRSAPTDNVYMARLDPPDLIPNRDGTWPAATAELAEYYHPVQFRVKELVAEVDYGQAGWSAATNDRYISASVRTPGAFIEREETLDVNRSATSTITHILPARNQTGVNYSKRRSFVRFNLTDGGETFTASPIITLSGVKLRRVIMRCVEAT